jgi:hypothetical protein
MRNLTTLPISSFESLPLRSPIRRPRPRPLGSYAALAELDDIRLLDRLETEALSASSYFSR